MQSLEVARPEASSDALTPAQSRIVEWGDGPLVVIAGAGTGKTRVIAERVRRLLETKGQAATDPSGDLIPPEPILTDQPFSGSLVPEQVLVLTYNVKAAKELADRIEGTVGPAVRARLSVSNFHSFCHRVLAESSVDAGLPARPDVLDGIGQILLLRDIRPHLELVYYAGGGNPNYWLDQFVSFINRAKDELVTPDQFDAFVARETAVFQDRYGSYEAARERLRAQGNLRPLKEVRGAYRELRREERAEQGGRADADPRIDEVFKTADREARRTMDGTGFARSRTQFDPSVHPQIDELADSYVVDGAALEVMQLSELALVYRSYQQELAERGALDFGEQISAVTQLFKLRPNVLRRYQRQFRYILVDEFQDANIAQIELIELLGRTPDRPDNVMVVGDDDQSIYRFRGASFAAFVEFDRRFGGPPRHDPTARVPGAPARLRIEDNFRSVIQVLTAANRLITKNELRYAPDKRLEAIRGSGEPVVVVTCADAEDEAREIVDRIRAVTGWDPAATAPAEAPQWSEFAVLYRKHRHREAIVTQLRHENIPYTVVGGLSLFDTPEIRDLEQSLRAIADPMLDVALVRMMSSGPWRLDALEILQVARMAKYDNRHLFEVIKEVVASGEVDVDKVRAADDEVPAEPATVLDVTAADDSTAGGLALQPPPTDLTAPTDGAATNPPAPPHEKRRIRVPPATRAKLQRLLSTLDELTPETWREGPFTILERYVVKTGIVFDRVAVDTLETKRMVANIASFMRFASEWQAEHPRGTLANFVDYLDAYQNAGGELPTSVELTEDVNGVRLMTLYQAKGLEFANVFVPQLVKDEWPAREYGSGLFPKDLLREPVPSGDIHVQEERRLLYVAMTRAKDRLVLTSVTSKNGEPRDPSPFVRDIADDAGPELILVDRTAALTASGAGITHEPATVPRVPSARDRRLALRIRATELIGLLEGVEPDDHGADAARTALAGDLERIGRSATMAADEARRLGIDPLTLQTLAVDSEAGANLLDIAALPSKLSYSQFQTYESCPLMYAFSYVYRIPSSRVVSAFTFGSSAHTAFETFTRERRERLARGEPPPTREDLVRIFEESWTAGGFDDRTAEETYRRRTTTLLDNFWQGELHSQGTSLSEEISFELTLEPTDGSTPVIVTGSIDRIDRLPSGGIEVIDYKTGRLTSQKGVHESLQLSIYALACRDALGLGTPEKVTLYFTESATRMSTTRTDEQLDAVRDDILARVARIRSGDFAATPSPSLCWRCDYNPVCPSRAR